MFLNKERYPREMWDKIDFFNENYDYCYLESMHWLNAKEQPDVIFTGLSYGVNAFEMKGLNKSAVNLSMHSQDLYYDYLHIKKLMENNKKIKKCVLTLSYYSMYYDISLCSQQYKCDSIYYPLFGDRHHHQCEKVFDFSSGEYESKIDLAHKIFAQTQSYYAPGIITREAWASYCWNIDSWSTMSDEARVELAKGRVYSHIKHFTHKETFIENSRIFAEIVKLLQENGIKLYVVVLPYSDTYLKLFPAEYRGALLSYLEMLPFEIDYVDMNEFDCFDDNDFADMDHLSTIGAEKVTGIANELLRN